MAESGIKDRRLTESNPERFLTFVLRAALALLPFGVFP